MAWEVLKQSRNLIAIVLRSITRTLNLMDILLRLPSTSSGDCLTGIPQCHTKPSKGPENFAVYIGASLKLVELNCLLVLILSKFDSVEVRTDEFDKSPLE